MRRVVWIYKRRNPLFTYKYHKEERSENITDGSVLSSLSFKYLQAVKTMLVNMCEINRKKNIIFGHQFVNAIQNVTFTVIQPRGMFNKMCYG